MPNEKSPTLIQKFVAVLPGLWLWSGGLGAVGVTAGLLRDGFVAGGGVWFWVLAVIALATAFCAGWAAAVAAGHVVLAPILYYQGLANGGPFRAGDWVQVLAGKHRGRVVQVYTMWQNETVRVDLGEQARQAYTDIFADFQLLRVAGEHPAELPAEPVDRGDEATPSSGG